SFLDRGLMINPPFRVSYSVTSIMSQRSLFNQSLGNIFYEAIRGILHGLTLKPISLIIATPPSAFLFTVA
ncbi:MAG: hypothetical protein WBN53_18190, partial [Thermodesulfobacteriota bacterium]